MAQAFLKDNFAGYKDVSETPKTDAVKLKLSNAINGSAQTDASSPVQNKNEYGINPNFSGIKAIPTSKMKLNTYSLTPEYNKLPDAQKRSIIKDDSYVMIDEAEGTKKDQYAVYNDTLKNPTTGTGILVSGLNDYLGHKYNPKNESDRKSLDVYQVKMKDQAVASAYKQASELGFSADAIPILASVNYQLGNGWKSEFKQSYGLLKKGDYDGAIKNIRDSDWHGQTKNRAEAFIAAIEQQKEFRLQGRLSNVDKQYDRLDRTKIILPDDGSAKKLAELEKNIQSTRTPVAMPLTPVINKPYHDDTPLLTTIHNGQAHVKNIIPSMNNWLDTKHAENLVETSENSKKRIESQIAEKNVALKALLSDTGTLKEYKNATTDSQRKLILLKSELLKKDQENAERADALKHGIFH
jgi:hypothetical protein